MINAIFDLSLRNMRNTEPKDLRQYDPYREEPDEEDEEEVDDEEYYENVDYYYNMYYGK